MKPRKLKTIVVPAVALAAAINLSPAFAAPPDGAFDRSPDHAADRSGGRRGERKGDRHRSGNPEVKASRIFNSLDTDENEVITLDEFIAKPLAKAETQFDRVDTDDDSLISLEEFLATHHDRGEGRGEDRPEIDHDAVRACVAEELDRDVPERPDRETRFGEIDTNGDGFVDYDEFVASKEAHATAKFNLIDEDADGGITEEELTAAIEAQHDIRRVHRDCVEEQLDADELLEG
ncbi:MAG: hypothetical protein HOC70_14870 [Gammaproteobacteria bacterium]|jgi:Ca2+-binding EF-hand superfamily protein|nr:hypothetical protein [Gammaproteobacteria bacterium]MBT7371733.1 hypothetical protein [Gammaproteobacteria bacterium]